MALNIALKKTKNTAAIKRFKAAIELFNTLFLNLTYDEKVTFYRTLPLKEFNEHIESVPLDFGVLEYLEKRLKEETVVNNAGIEIEFKIKSESKYFNIIFTLFPEDYATGLRFDISIDALPNVYIKEFDDLKRYIPNLTNLISKKIKEYNNKTTSLKIRKAILCPIGYEVHKIKYWSLFYSSNPDEFITHLSFVYKPLMSQLVFANRKRFADELFKNPIFWAKLEEFAKANEVGITGGSITLIPTDKVAMEKFVNETADIVTKIAKKLYPNKEKLVEKINSALNY